jgi:hypothetical protein
LLSDFLADFGLRRQYEIVRETVYREARAGGRRLVKETVIEERVNRQFEHYREMFGQRYTREEARFTACCQIANLMALSVIFENFPGSIVVIDDRGRENNLIGGYRPGLAAVYFTKLKDPVIIKK